MLRAVPFVLSEDPRMNIVLAAIYAAEGGPMYSAAIYGIAWLVKQIIKRATPSVEQQANEDDPAFKAEEESALGAFYTLVYHYTVGQLPDDTKGFVKMLAAANIAFAFVKNLDGFSTFIIRLIKSAVNYTWYAVTGTYFFDKEQNECTDQFHAIADDVRVAEANKSLSGARLKLILDKLDALVIRATDCDAPRDFVTSIVTYTNAFKNRSVHLASDHAFKHKKPPTTGIAIIGQAGIGKTSLIRTYVAGLARLHGFADDPEDLVWVYQPGVNFQSPLPKKPFIAIFDDSALVDDPQATKDALSFMMRLSSDVPTMIDQPFSKNIDWADFRYFIFTGNKFDTQHVSNSKAFYRRFNGGFWTLTLDPDFADPNGIYDEAKVEIHNAHPDQVWTFHSPGVKPVNMSGAVAIAHAVAKRSADSHSRRKEVATLHDLDVEIPSFPFMNMDSTDVGRYIGQFTSKVPGTPRAKGEDVKPVLSEMFSSPFKTPVSTSDEESSPRPKGKGVPTRFTEDDPADFSQPPASPSLNVTKQGFTGKFVPDAIHSSIDDDRLRTTALNFMQRSKTEFTVVNGQIMADGKPFDLSGLIGAYVKPNKIKPQADIRVPLDKWTSAHFFVARNCMFSMSEEDAAFETYSYSLKKQALTSANGPDSQEVNFNQFCLWALVHPELCGDNLMVFAMERDRPVETWKTKYPYLYLAVVALTSSVVGMLISIALTQVIGYVTQQSYSVKTIVKNPRTSLAPVKQGFIGALSIDGIMSKFARNTIPATTLSGTKTQSFFVTGLCSNLAKSTKHCFDDATHIAMSGVIGAVFPLKFFNEPEDVPENITHYVACVPEKGADGMWLVFPKTTPFFTDVTKFLCHSDQDVHELTGCGLVSVPHDLEFLDANDNPTEKWGSKAKNSPVHKGDFFPLGDADVAANYDDADLDGLFIDAVAPTRNGDCGKICITTNNRVGRGVRISPGCHGGYLESHKKAVTIPNTIEMVEDFMARCPGVTRVRPEGLIEFVLPLDNERDNWTGPFSTPSAQVPNDEASYVSTRNTIIPSPIAGATHGMPYDDITGGDITSVPIPFMAPAKMRDVPAAFAKAKYNVIPTNELDISAHYAAAERVFVNVVNEAPEYFEAQSSLFTIEQALNGIPEWGVPSLDLNKARGVFPGCKLRNRRDLVDKVDGALAPKPFFRARVNELIAKFLDGTLPVPTVSGNLKVELRDPLKPARTTRTFSFEHLVAIRCFSMHVPAAYHKGRLRNRSMVGADLTGGDGFMLHKRATAADRRGKHLNDGDASSFDFSENIVVAGATEGVHARMIRLRFPFVSMACADAVAMTVRFANVIVGNKLYSQWNSVLSGSFWTTVHNTATISAIVIGAAIILDMSPDVYHQAYGDDFSIEDNPDDVLINGIARHAKALNVTITPSKKRETELATSTPTSLVRLKRTTYERNGVVYAPLDVSVLAHIGDWIDAKDRPDVAVPVVAESAIREWFHHGQRNFENAKARINQALAQKGFRQIPLTYHELYVDHLRRGPYAYAKVEKQSLSKDISAPRTAPPVVISSGDTMSHTMTTSVQGQGVGTVTTPESGTITQHKLTQYRDDAGMSSSKLTPYVRSQVANPLKPYPPMGVEGIILREYPVGEFSMATTDPSLTVYPSFDFPKVLYAIPTIKEKLSSSKYFRAAVRITARINGQMSCAGKIGFAVVRGGTKNADPRLPDQHIYLNMPLWTLSASTSVPVSFEIPWCAETLYDDLPNATAEDGCCTVIPFVINPLVWVTASPPTSLNVTLYASFLEPTISGFDIAGGPPVARQVLKEATRTPTLRVTGVHKQSSSSEGLEKSIKGVVEGVASAADTVKTVINAVKTVAEIGAFDKPMSLQASMPAELGIAHDFTHANGLNNATTMALSQDVPASVKDRLVGEETPKPSWDQILGTPGFLDWISIGTADPPGTLIAEFAVDPCAMHSLAGSGGGSPWMPTPLAYWATTHSLWRGTLKYLISLSCPTLEKCTIRISYLPTSVPAGVAISPDVTGDVMGMVVEICGDKDITFCVDYDRPTPYSRIRGTGPVADINSNGRIVIQLVTALSGPAAANVPAVNGTIYVAAEKGFQLIGYNGPQGYKPTWTPDAAKSVKGLKAKDLKVTKQSCIQDLFGTPFKPLAPSSRKDTTGFVSNDTSSGPCDVLRRPHVNAEDNNTTPSVALPSLLPSVPVGTGPFAYHILPFQGWSGSLTVHMVPAAGFGPNDIYTASRVQSAVTNVAQGGQVFWYSAVNPLKSITIPWTEAVIYMPFYNTTIQRLTPSPYVDLWDSVATPILYFYFSANDDFCLYHFVACPFLTD